MNDHSATRGPDRATWAANFFSRLNRYRNLLRRRWWVVLLVVGFAVAIQGAILNFEPLLFSSAGRMMVSIKINVTDGAAFSEEMANYLGTQAALMQSGTVINRATARLAAQKPDLVAQPVSLAVSILPRTTIFTLRATGSDPQYTQAFLQACMDEYMNWKKEMRSSTSDSAQAGLTEQILALERDLDKAQSELISYQSTNNVVVQEEQSNSANRFLGTLTQRLAEKQSAYDLLASMTVEMTLQSQQTAGTNAVSGAGESASPKPQAPQMGVGTTYYTAKQEISKQKAELAELNRYLREKHPKIVALKKAIASNESLLGIYREQSGEQLENLKQSLQVEVLNLQKDVKKWEATVLDINGKMAAYQRLKANAARTQAMYDRLLQNTKQLDVSREMSPDGIVQMEKASTAVAGRPELRRSLLVAGLVGLAIGVALLLLLDRLDDRLNSFTELEQSFDETVLGQIPREKVARKRRAVSLLQPDDPRHSFVESYRNLRSSLLYLSVEGERPRILLVTSSIPNDGKSMTAANLAITLASAGSQVLLVDADLRKGVLDGRFGVPSEPGLSEVLTKGTKWSEAVQATQIPNLFLLPRGESTHKSAELFLSQTMSVFMKEVAEKYDYVMFDTAPVMAADDVTSLAPRVDGVIFVIRAEHTSARVARSALDLLYQRQTRVAGIVFNGVRTRTGDYYYYYKYKDYYRKYPTSAAAKT
jgi:capsular exopolysaccharide synthesis family protein